MKAWQGRVRNVYCSLDELKAYDLYYDIVKRCGYKSAEALWKANPMIEGSIHAEDFGKARK